jgi:hypothetical protein
MKVISVIERVNVEVYQLVAPQNLIRTYGDLKGGPDGTRRRPTVPICPRVLRLSPISFAPGHVAAGEDVPRIRF